MLRPRGLERSARSVTVLTPDARSRGTRGRGPIHIRLLYRRGSSSPTSTCGPIAGARTPDATAEQNDPTAAWTRWHRRGGVGWRGAKDAESELANSDHRNQTAVHREMVETALQSRGDEPSRLKDAALGLRALTWAAFFGAQPDTPAKLAAFVRGRAP